MRLPPRGIDDVKVTRGEHTWVPSPVQALLAVVRMVWGTAYVLQAQMLGMLGTAIGGDKSSGARIIMQDKV